MGMDYYYMGSSSYPRFNGELEGIVKLFGGKTLTKRKPQEECTIIEYFMEKPLTYEFPEGTSETFVKWANDPYGDFTAEETKEVFDIISTKLDEAEKISEQIVGELKYCVEDKTYWDIH